MGHSSPLAAWKVIRSTPSDDADSRLSDRNAVVKESTVESGSRDRWSWANSRKVSMLVRASGVLAS